MATFPPVLVIGAGVIGLSAAVTLTKPATPSLSARIDGRKSTHAE